MKFMSLAEKFQLHLMRTDNPKLADQEVKWGQIY